VVLLYGSGFLLPVAFLGMLGGLAGAALAHARFTGGSARRNQP
jgi:hypothetical protein